MPHFLNCLLLLIWSASLLAGAELKVEVVGQWQSPHGQRFENVEVGGFSGLHYLASADQLLGLQDRPVGKNNSSTLMKWKIGRLGPGMRPLSPAQQVRLDLEGVQELGPLPASYKWPELSDLEGLAPLPTGQWLVSSEGGPDKTQAQILRFHHQWRFMEFLPEVEFYRPEGKKGVQKNQSLEALSTSPSGKVLFTANEMPLLQDAQAQLRQVRLVRFTQDKKGHLAPSDWVYYPLEAEVNNGLVELAAVNERALYTLERSFDPATRKNTIRAFFIKYPAKAGKLSGEQAPLLQKELVFDLGELVPKLTAPFNKLDNYEGMALGRLEHGRREIFLATDDNFSAKQLTMVLVLRVPEPLPVPLKPTLPKDPTKR